MICVMMLDENILKTEERIMYTLRSVYHKSGYAPFKMSRFEEYDMYVRNKNFMGGSKIVSFTDSNAISIFFFNDHLNNLTIRKKLASRIADTLLNRCFRYDKALRFLL